MVSVRIVGVCVDFIYLAIIVPKVNLGVSSIHSRNGSQAIELTNHEYLSVVSEVRYDELSMVDVTRSRLVIMPLYGQRTRI